MTGVYTVQHNADIYLLWRKLNDLSVTGVYWVHGVRTNTTIGSFVTLADRDGKTENSNL